jgi:PAS domain S-box-containing protein
MSSISSTDPADLKLEYLRRQHQLILNAVGEGVYGLDLNGRVTFVNPAAAEMIGWDMQDLIGQSMHAVLHHSHEDGSHYPREECPIYLAFQDGIIHRVTDEVFWRKDGTQFPVEYISMPMRDEQGKLIGAVVTFRDITQRKWAETIRQRANEELELKVQERTAELQEVNQRLQELNDLKSRFVSMVCHEFRNPLNNIALSASSLSRYDIQLSAEQKLEYLTGIADNVERMTQMIDDILVIGKIEAKRLEVRRIPIELVQFCRDLIAEIQSMTPQPLKLMSRSKHLIAELDEQLLRSILSNILSNSIRYSPCDKAVYLKLFRHRGWVVFQVKDEGLGILPEDQPHLFDPFHRGRNVSNIPGTGLGLNIVKRFVDLHCGKIEVESKVGLGTTFTVRLPMQDF